MSFLLEEDYRVVAGDTALKVLQQHDAAIRARAETVAIDEIKGYLATRYDADQVFKKTGDNRSNVIVMRTVDVALYHLVSASPQRMGVEIREKRYDQAIKWLQELQKGNIAADLPKQMGPNGEEDINQRIRFNPGQKNEYDW